MRWDRAASLAVALALGWSGGIVLAQTKEPFKLGVALPLTGGNALYGTDQLQAVRFAVEDINAAGGVGGRQFEVVALDTQATPQLGINAVNRFASVDKTPAFITGFSQVVMAVAPIANREKLLELVIGANAPKIAQLGDYVFTTYPLSDVDITKLTHYLYTEMGKRKAAVIYINNDTGLFGAQQFRDDFTKAGGEIVAYEAYEATASDYTGALLKVRAAQPDEIHIQGLISDTPQVIAQMRQLGITAQVSSYAVAYNPKLIEQLGAAAEGLIVTSVSPDSSMSPAVKTYVERWQKTIGRVPNGLPYTVYMYDAPYIVKQLIEAVDRKGLAITGETLRDALAALGPTTVPLLGPIDIKSNHTIITPIYLMQVKNGAFVPIAKL